MRRGAARFTVDAAPQRAGDGELFVLEPEAVHTGIPAVPEGWAYEVLYLDPRLIAEWAEDDGPPPGAASWVVFRDPALRSALGRAHRALAAPAPRLEVDEAVARAVGLPPHAFQIDLRVRRARALLRAGEPPAAVAAACGFADQPHLTRTFKRAVGVTPGRYARPIA